MNELIFESKPHCSFTFSFANMITDQRRHLPETDLQDKPSVYCSNGKVMF